MAPQLDTAQRRAVLAEIAKKLVLQINEIQPFQWDKHDDKDQAIVLAALLATDQQARREALEEAAKVARDRALLWKSHGGAKMASPYGHLTVEGECEVIASELDRLRERVEG